MLYFWCSIKHIYKFYRLQTKLIYRSKVNLNPKILFHSTNVALVFTTYTVAGWEQISSRISWLSYFNTEVIVAAASADGKVLWIRFEYDVVVIHSLYMGICGSLRFDIFSGVCSLASWCFRLLWWSELYRQASQCLGRHVLNEERRVSSWSVRIKCHPAF